MVGNKNGDGQLARQRETITFKQFVVRHVFSLVVALAILSIASPVAVPVISRLEGDVLPVATNFEVVSSASQNSQTFIYVTFNKARHCEFLGVNWYLDTTRLNVVFLEDKGKAPLSRPVGGQTTGPWRIDIPTLDGTTAEVLHRCHNLWLTTTKLYP